MKEDLTKLKALPYVKSAKHSGEYYMVKIKKDVLSMRLHHTEGVRGGWVPIRTKRKPRIVLPQYEVRIRRFSEGNFNFRLRLVNKPMLIAGGYKWKVTTNSFGYCSQLENTVAQAQTKLTTTWYDACQGEWSGTFRAEKDIAKYVDIVVAYLQCAIPDGVGLVRRAQWAKALSLTIKP